MNHTGGSHKNIDKNTNILSIRDYKDEQDHNNTHNYGILLHCIIENGYYENKIPNILKEKEKVQKVELRDEFRGHGEGKKR